MSLDIDYLRKRMDRWSETFRASVDMERALQSVFWDDSWPQDLRRHWDKDERWFWSIPDYENGRSRVVGVEGNVLRERELDEIRVTLEENDWLQELEGQNLLVAEEDGNLVVRVWEPSLEEAWFKDPRGGYYCAFEQESIHAWRPGPPFLCLQGKTWSAMGPKNPRPATSYTAEELTAYIPDSVRQSHGT